MDYSTRDTVSPEEMLALAESVGFGPHRTLRRNRRTLQASCFIATARCDGRLVGLLRLIGDGAYILHIADLMVHPSQQGRGVGRRLVQLAIDYAVREGIGVGDGLGEFTLFAATGAEGFYRKLQFASLPNGMFYADCEERVQAAAETRQHWRSSTEGNQP